MDTTQAAIVSGGGQGIGRAITKKLLQSGWHLVMAEIDTEAGQETEEDYPSLQKAVSSPDSILSSTAG